jgi:hypothetical protein
MSSIPPGEARVAGLAEIAALSVAMMVVLRPVGRGS